jgi:phenylacetate-coenzyme A ligase PaaK-like adenylate-forming protein
MPAPAASSALESLMASEDVYHITPSKDAVFVEAMRDAIAHHRKANALYDALCKHKLFEEAQIKEVGDLAAVPHLFVNVLKRYEILSIARDDIKLHLTSSGTTGQKSQIFFDEGSLQRGLAMVEACFGANGLINHAQEVNYLIFAHDPAHAPNRGTSYTDHSMTNFTARREIFYGIQWSTALNDWQFELEASNAKLEAFAASDCPTRIIGFPAFLHRLMRYRKEQGLPSLYLGPEAYILTAGGWKKNENEAIPKAEFVKELTALLGVNPENIRDGYGMVEHGVPYIECSHHRFHVPHYARALARDVGSLRPLPDGEAGFLNLITPYMLAVPAISLLTSDLATVGHDCPCGRNTATIEIQGRAGTRKNKGCAISAAQLIR